jgi:serine/threonine protein kinase
MSPRPDRFGDYELVKYLTAGGMADLYLARCPKYAGDLVVKKIQPRYVDFTRVVKMFIDEGRIAQALEHPNIVKIVDVGQEGGTYFIAMEYIAGRDLLAICRRGVEVGNFLPRHLAVAILVQALSGLQHAHEKAGADGESLKVVHCDISPGNIVVSWGGTAKIVDFGISRATIQLRNEDHSVAGKYNYMAPEQIRGEAVDQRTDIFAIGIILYELTCGKRLFRGRPEQVIQLVVEEPIVAPTTLRPDFPARLERIILRCLERDPSARYQSARALRGDLRAWLQEEGQPCGKHQLAVYLREIFGAEKQRESEEFGTGSSDDDELILERGLPRTESGMHELPLAVDREDPDEPAPTPEPEPDRAPAAEAVPVLVPLAGTAPAALGVPVQVPASVPAMPPPKPATPAPAASRPPGPLVVALAAAVVAALVAGFLLWG